jgi:hypothetical protein
VGTIGVVRGFLSLYVFSVMMLEVSAMSAEIVWVRLSLTIFEQRDVKSIQGMFQKWLG